MGSSLAARAALASAVAWRLLIVSVIATVFPQVAFSPKHLFSAFVLAAALGLTLFDVARLALRPAPERPVTIDMSAQNTARQCDRLSALLDAVTVALFVLGADGRVACANRAARRFTGHDSARLSDIAKLGAEASARIEALPPGGRQLVTAADGATLLVWIVVFTAPGLGEERLVSIQPVVGELDAVQIGAWHAMTRVLSHEVLGSLTPIASLAESLPELAVQEGADTEVAAAVRTIARRSRHLLNFVDRYRQIAEMPAADLANRDLAPFLADLARPLRAMLRERGIALLLNDMPAAVPARFDPELLGQAITNLVQNAADALQAADSPKVTVSCERDAATVTLSVRDNGTGIDPIRLDEVFIPFFTTKADGSGIGLALARQIALAHGGQITVNANPDRGVTFHLTLPV